MKIATQTLPPSPDLSLCEASTTKPVRAALTVLGAISFCHMLNDLLQSLMPAIYPVLRLKFGLSFGQIGLIALVNQVTASLLQPVVGNFTDRRPTPYALPIGMGFTLVGLLILSVAWSYPIVIGAVALVGIGSAVFHPESSRIARLASGGKHGFAQSIFQVGGNAGAALGPLMAAYVVVIGGAGGQRRIAWFSIVALTGILVLAWVAKWHRQHMRARSA
jgi:FSR family fosmidomycin resistance protein-like MFS transporter